MKTLCNGYADIHLLFKQALIFIVICFNVISCLDWVTLVKEAGDNLPNKINIANSALHPSIDFLAAHTSKQTWPESLYRGREYHVTCSGLEDYWWQGGCFFGNVAAVPLFGQSCVMASRLGPPSSIFHPSGYQLQEPHCTLKSSDTQEGIPLQYALNKLSFSSEAISLNQTFPPLQCVLQTLRCAHAFVPWVCEESPCATWGMHKYSYSSIIKSSGWGWQWNN